MKAAYIAFIVFALVACACAYKSEILKDHGLPDHLLQHITSPLPHEYINPQDLPSSFSWHDQRDVQLTPVKNQHVPVYCGSCWCFGNLSALSDRIAIIRKGAWPQVQLGCQAILNCGRSSGSCNGGTSPGLLSFLKQQGVSVEECLNYEAKNGTCEDERSWCKDCSRDDFGSSYCWPLTNYTRVHVEEYGSVYGIDKIKAEIYSRGPVSAGINANGILNLTNSFYRIDEPICRKYGSGVNHVVSIVGWVTEDVMTYDDFGLPAGTTTQSYWIIRNSWGSSHGMNGLGKILMGQDCLGIEQYVYWATPKLSDLPPY